MNRNSHSSYRLVNTSIYTSTIFINFKLSILQIFVHENTIDCKFKIITLYIKSTLKLKFYFIFPPAVICEDVKVSRKEIMVFYKLEEQLVDNGYNKTSPLLKVIVIQVEDNFSLLFIESRV